MGDQRAQVQVPRSAGNCPGSVLLLFAGYAQGDCQLSVARAGESGIGVGDSAAVVVGVACRRTGGFPAPSRTASPLGETYRTWLWVAGAGSQQGRKCVGYVGIGCVRECLGGRRTI